MTRRKLLSVILAVVMLSATVLFTGCKDTTVGKSNWTTNGGDPAIKKQDEVLGDDPLNLREQKRYKKYSY